MTVPIPNDDIATVPLIFKDQAGHTMGGDTESNITVTVSDPTLATAVLTSDGNWVVITPLVASGAGTVTYTDPNETPALTATVDFTIVPPQPISAAFNEGGVVLTANPSPPAGAPGSTITGAASTTGTGGGSGTTTTSGGAASTGGGVSGTGAASVSGGAASG